MNDLTVIIQCGKRKQIGMHNAIDLYNGAYFSALRKYALSITSMQNIYIHSAKHGIIKSMKQIRTYDCIMRNKQYTMDTLAGQVLQYDLKDKQVLFIGGSAYWKDIIKVLPQARHFHEFIPNQDTDKRATAMGNQLHHLKRSYGQRLW